MLTVIVNGDVLGRLIMHLNYNLIVLIDLKHRTRRLAVHEQHLPREAIWGVVIPCYGQVKMLCRIPVSCRYGRNKRVK